MDSQPSPSGPLAALRLSGQQPNLVSSQELHSPAPLPSPLPDPSVSHWKHPSLSGPVAGVIWSGQQPYLRMTQWNIRQIKQIIELLFYILGFFASDGHKLFIRRSSSGWWQCSRLGASFVIVTLGRSEFIRAAAKQRSFTSVRETSFVVFALGRRDAVRTALEFRILARLEFGTSYNQRTVKWELRLSAELTIQKYQIRTALWLATFRRDSIRTRWCRISVWVAEQLYRLSSSSSFRGSSWPWIYQV